MPLCMVSVNTMGTSRITSCGMTSICLSASTTLSFFPASRVSTTYASSLLRLTDDDVPRADADAAAADAADAPAADDDKHLTLQAADNDDDNDDDVYDNNIYNHSSKHRHQQ
mmetsp:Transcript_12517/g.28448  ORF Transcript_12517/g.28448 Transcript_12517/m.28448 type:complete len:112 (-) Transcript_12517:1548-1883(-)